MGADLSERKAAARKAAFARRKSVRSRQSSDAACAHLIDYLRPFRGQAISGYMPIQTEIDILPAMSAIAAASPVGVPVILGAGQALEFHAWTPESDMIDGPFGAKVPKVAKILIPRVVILPLVAFDPRGYRLGYGGGFYDRTLENLNKIGPVTSIGFAFAGQCTDEVPIEATDQRLDAIVTEEGVTEFSAS